TIIACADDEDVVNLLSKAQQHIIWYGQAQKADWRLNDIDHQQQSFSITHRKQHYRLHSPLAGEHNMLNTTAAFIACQQLGITCDAFQQALTSFKGAERRFKVLGQINGVT